MQRRNVNYDLYYRKAIYMIDRDARQRAYRSGSVEFGGGIIERIIYKFLRLPYIWQSNYAQTINDLTEIFYFFQMNA